MRVALCQIPVSSQPAVNLARVREALSGAAAQHADLAVFPEATQIRFGCDPRPVARPVGEGFAAGLAAAAAGTGWPWSRASSPRPRTVACTTPPWPSTAAGTWSPPTASCTCSTPSASRNRP
ncbi:MAG TPA: nitrilase-related carbon-nitrogen hydrolase [Streptosporangiaceae bacterium]